MVNLIASRWKWNKIIALKTLKDFLWLMRQRFEKIFHETIEYATLLTCARCFLSFRLKTCLRFSRSLLYLDIGGKNIESYFYSSQKQSYTNENSLMKMPHD